MEGVAGVIAVREYKGLSALALCPHVCEQWGVPVDFVEDVRGMDPAFGAVGLAAGGAGTAWPCHVVLVVVETGCRVIAGWEMDVGTKRRCISVAVLIREAGTCTCIVGIDDPRAVHAVRVHWVRWWVVGCAWACELDWLWNTVIGVGDGRTTTSWWGAKLDITDEHAMTWLECNDVIIRGLKAGRMEY